MKRKDAIIPIVNDFESRSPVWTPLKAPDMKLDPEGIIAPYRKDHALPIHLRITGQQFWSKHSNMGGSFQGEYERKKKKE